MFRSIGKFTNLFIKPGKSILTNSVVKQSDDLFCFAHDVGKTADGKVIRQISKQNQANLGDTSLWVESELGAQLPVAKAEVKEFFTGLKTVGDVEKNIMMRSKGALSINAKLERGLKEKGIIDGLDDALKIIEDGIGSRVVTKSLNKLSKTEIDDMIAKTMIEGRKITSEEARLLRNYIYSPNPSKCSEKAFKLYEQFAQPLIEKRSKEVVDKLTLGILKQRQLSEGLDINKLRAKELFDDEIFKLAGDWEKIKPLQVTEINNYRGLHGLPEFTNNQIQQLSRAMNYGRKGKPLVVISDVRGLDDFLYPAEQIQKLGSKSIKKSGYRTAQINVIHSNGARGEIQFRGQYTNTFGEFEHIAYDLRQGKNTLGPLFDDFSKAIKKLNPKEYGEYNKYLESCYNYYNRIELGLPAVKPKLPSKFPKVLSEESMKSLHDKAESLEKMASKNFVRYIEQVA